MKTEEKKRPKTERPTRPM